MLKYSWFWWAMYIWGLNTRHYFNFLTSVIDCGISNKVEDSAYANPDYRVEHWQPAVEEMTIIFEELDYWWHPALVWFVSYTGIGFIAYTIANLVMMTQY